MCRADRRRRGSGTRRRAGLGRAADRFQNGIPPASCVSPDYAFQLATYRQITPGANGEVRIDSLVKTQTVQIVRQAYTVDEPDIRATKVLYPMAQKAMGSGMYCPNRQSMLCSQSIAASGSTAKRSSTAGFGRPELRPYSVNAKRPAQAAIARPGPGRLSSESKRLPR